MLSSDARGGAYRPWELLVRTALKRHRADRGRDEARDAARVFLSLYPELVLPVHARSQSTVRLTLENGVRVPLLARFDRLPAHMPIKLRPSS